MTQSTIRLMILGRILNVLKIVPAMHLEQNYVATNTGTGSKVSPRFLVQYVQTQQNLVGRLQIIICKMQLNS